MNRTLLVMIKPDGVRRICAHEEVVAITTAWRDLLFWLQGADVHEQAIGAVLASVAQTAGLQMIRSNDYDIRSWQRQARDLSANDLQLNGDLSLAEILCRFAHSLGFRREPLLADQPDPMLIELIYQRSPRYAAHRSVLLPRLLSGPVDLQLWHGSRHELAFALKIVIRRSLSSAAITNLLHMEAITPDQVEELKQGLPRSGAAASAAQTGGGQAA